jgi:hypothetical protein
MARENIVNYREVGQQRADPLVSRGATAITTGFQDPRRDKDIRLRDRTIELHRPEGQQNLVSKFIHQTKDVGDQAVKAGSLSLGAAFHKIKDILTSGIMGGNIGDVAKGLLGGTLGLQTIRSLLGAPKFISDPASRKEHAPLVLNTVKLITGASIAYGLFGGLMGKVGFSPTGLGVGVAIYCVTSLFSGLYNPNSIFSKLLGALGLRDSFVEVMDSLKIEENFYK